MRKYIDEDHYDHGTSSSYGKKSRNSSSSSETSKSTGIAAIADSGPTSSFNIKNMDEDEERDLRRYEIQCELNNQGASDLVVDLFMNDISNKVFKETVLLAIALLEGGNTQVQVDIINI